MANKVQKTKMKLDKTEERLSKAQEKIPKKRQKSKLVHKEVPKSKLSFEESKPKPSEKLMNKPKPPSKLGSEIKSIHKKQMIHAFHKQMAKYEEDNAGVDRETKGNKPNIFLDSVQSGVPPVDYEIPGDSLTDPQFAALIREVEKYLGYPYVWGGSSPFTSFDCSGFVSLCNAVHNETYAMTMFM